MFFKSAENICIAEFGKLVQTLTVQAENGYFRYCLSRELSHVGTLCVTRFTYAAGRASFSLICHLPLETVNLQQTPTLQ